MCPFRSKREASQGAYTFQIFLEKEQMGRVPTVQQLLDTSCLSGDLKFETVSLSVYKSMDIISFPSVQSYNHSFAFFLFLFFLCAPQMPSCLMIQMPRFGNKYKMFSHIIPSMELDITDLLYNCEEQM